MRISAVITIMALVSSVGYGFRPSSLTELLLWGACVMFIYERDHER
jgi:hypothetical protein